MITEPIGIYVHTPFCKSKCAYCDFVSFGGALSKYEEQYVNALINEICEYKTEDKIKVDTVFFGGGTPSILSPASFEKIAKALKDVFEILPKSEFTVEANPKTLSEEKLNKYTEHGVNRISLGLQTIHENELKILGRIHNFEELCDSYALCQNYGISNINVDLMYAIPEQTTDSFRTTLEKIISLSPLHISAYSLILEEGTRLYEKRNSLTFPSEQEECDMYYMAADMLKAAGYSHYEISNYAKPGFECKHNLKYWKDKEYVGLGLAAHSYFGKKRYSNPVEFSEYFSHRRKEYRQIQLIGAEDNAYEYAMMHLRLSCGFSLRDYEERFKRSFLEGKESYIERLVSSGYVSLADNRIALTEKGFYVSNAILTELL